MKKYYVTVNGNRYEVEVEEVKNNFDNMNEPAPQAQQSQAQPAASTASSAATKKTQPKNTPSEGEKINCPMPGTIVNINIKEGDSIKKGDLLFVLEAMKMENEIVSPVDGTVASIAVTKGETVNTEDLLAVIE